MLKFEIKHKDGLARVGIIHTPHGDIKTPAFVGAATRATVKALTMKEMNELGSQAILANTYHLILRPGTELIEEAGGLAEFSSWHKPTFTDSGGFQIFSLPNVKISENGVKFKSHIDGANFGLTPESSMQAQWAIGADIHMAFDHLAKSEKYEDMKLAMDRTHRWLDRCVTEHKRLREKAASESGQNAFSEGLPERGSARTSAPSPWRRAPATRAEKRPLPFVIALSRRSPPIFTGTISTPRWRHLWNMSTNYTSKVLAMKISSPSLSF
jgi:queuine tRNA-ribosyltransferase